MGFMDINLLGAAFSDYKLTDVGADAYQLEHDWFTKEDLQITTGPGGGGIPLSEGVDYQLLEEDEELSARVTAAIGAARTVFHKVQIINATYQTGDLYHSGKYIADSNSAADMNDFENRIAAIEVTHHKLLHIEDQKAANTEGGTFTNGAWRTRALTTVVTNEISGASLAANQITLPAGTYYIEASAPALSVHRHKTILYNITDAANELIGTSEEAGSGDSTCTRSFVCGRFQIAAQKIFELQHRCETTKATTGFGVASNFGVNEIYAIVKIWKIA